VQDITANLGFALSGRRILLLGAGGAARGVIAPLLAGRPASLHCQPQRRQGAGAGCIFADMAAVSAVVSPNWPAKASIW
jgi:shikimate dehydrogenase